MRFARTIVILVAIALFAGVVMLTARGFVRLGGPRTGVLEGTVWSYGCPAIKPGEQCGFPAADYELIVYRGDGVTMFARTKTDANGFYSLILPEGTYIVYGDCHIFTPCTNQNGTPRQVTIQAGQVTVLNITYDNGIR